MLRTEQDTPKAPFGKNFKPTSIHFKGRPGVLELILEQDAPLITILQELDQTLQKNAHLIGSPAIRIRFGSRPLDSLQSRELCRVLEKYNLQVEQINVNPEALQELLEGQFGFPVKIQPTEYLTPAPSFAKTTHVNPTPAPSSQAFHLPPKTQEEWKRIPDSSPPGPSSIRSNASSPPLPQRPLPPTHTKHSSFSHHNPHLLQKTPSDQHSRPPVKRLERPRKHRMPPPDSFQPLPELDHQPVPTTPPRRSTESPRVQPHTNNKKVHKIMKTCRAGTFLDFDGDVVVFGDINPGAEIRATGDIIVFGALRGIAHAGCKGDQKAIITAFYLNPTQLRLSDQIAIAPSNEGRHRSRCETEIAYLNQNHKIEVEKYQGKIPPILQQRFMTS